MTSNIVHDLIKNGSMSYRSSRQNSSRQYRSGKSSGKEAVQEMNFPEHLQLMPYDECVRSLMFHDIECDGVETICRRVNNRFPESIARSLCNKYIDAFESSTESSVVDHALSEHKRVKGVVDEFSNRQRFPFLVYPGLVNCDFIQRCLHVRFSKSSTPLQVIQDIHVAIIARCESAVHEHKRGNQEHYQYELMIALRAIYELKSVIPKAQSAPEKDLYHTYHSLFLRLNEQLDFCTIEQVLDIIITFRVLTKCWANIAQQRQARKLEQSESLRTHNHNTYNGSLIKPLFTNGRHLYPLRLDQPGL